MSSSTHTTKAAADAADVYERDAAFLRARVAVLRLERELDAARRAMGESAHARRLVDRTAIAARLAAEGEELAQLGGISGNGGSEQDVIARVRQQVAAAGSAERARTAVAYAERQLEKTKQHVSADIASELNGVPQAGRELMRRRLEDEHAPRIEHAQDRLGRAQAEAARLGRAEVLDADRLVQPEGDELALAVIAMVAAEAERFEALAAELRERDAA